MAAPVETTVIEESTNLPVEIPTTQQQSGENDFDVVNMILNATIDSLRMWKPEDVAEAEALLATLDINDPDTFTKIGVEAVESHTQSTLDSLKTLNEGPSDEVTESIETFNAKLLEDIEPLNKRLKQSGDIKPEKALAKAWKEGVAFVTSFSLSKEKREKKRRAQKSLELKDASEEIGSSKNELAQLTKGAIAGLAELNALIETSAEVPDKIIRTLTEDQKTQSVAVNSLMIGVVVLNEKQRLIREEELPGLEKEKEENPFFDPIQLENAQEALLRIEKQKTQIIKTMLTISRDRKIGRELINIARETKQDLKAMGSFVKGNAAQSLKTLSAELSAEGLGLTRQRISELEGQMSAATVKGLGNVVAAVEGADNAEDRTIEGLLGTTEQIKKIADDHLKHKAARLVRQKTVQAKATKMLEDVNKTAADLAKAKPNDDKPIEVDQKAVDELSLEATGYKASEVASEVEKRSSKIEKKPPQKLKL